MMTKVRSQITLLMFLIYSKSGLRFVLYRILYHVSIHELTVHKTSTFNFLISEEIHLWQPL